MDRKQQLELLGRFAPVVRYDGRELFFPIAVDGYIQSSSLHLEDQVALGPGEISENDLNRRLGAKAYLRFVSDSERRAVLRTESRQLARQLLGPRLGRVGLFGRILDALFLLSVFFRPTTPRLTTPAASIKSEAKNLVVPGAKPVVYGRVVEVANWIVLHYAYFYVMNDWRTTYRGLNDHEADWEQAWVVCDPQDMRPVWVVASNHDHKGSDLRRHWEDPELNRVNDRPVLFAGAGSHALYFYPGDYVTRIDVPGLRWLLRLQRWVRRTLRIRDQAAERGLGPALGVPFIDSATGDGHEFTDWDVQLLDNDRPCFGEFRGLWGLDTGDPMNGERGPSGPKFDRGGEIRTSWADPIGFAGLHGSNPPSLAPNEQSLNNLNTTLDYIDQEINRSSRLLPLVQQVESAAELVDESQRLSDLLRQRAELDDLRARLERGSSIDLDIRGHLKNPAVAMGPPQESGWLLAIWAAISVPLLLLSIAGVFLFDSLTLTTIFLATSAAFSLFEQLVRRHFGAVLRLTALYTLIVAVFVVARAVFSGVLTFSVIVVGAVIALAAVALFAANLGELTAVRRRAEVAEAVTTEIERDRS